MPASAAGLAARFDAAGGASAAVAETHSGVVMFVGDRAYKLKKPVDFGFLDFRRRDVRAAVCRREVELNRRLAPDVYLGVADVSGPDGELLDHLVVMRRLPADRRMTTLATAGVDLGDDVRRLARLLAAFHARAGQSPSIDRAATADAQRERWRKNTAEIARFAPLLLDTGAIGSVTGLSHRYLAGREQLFSARIAGGKARDGHGDLLADDIFLLDDGPRVLDCIEFDDKLRWGDVLGDVGFLAMDLERLDRPDLASALLDLYAQFAGDAWPPSLAHHYIAYRAWIRTKVACLRHEQSDARSAGQVRRLLAMTLHHLEAGRVRLVLVGGLPGTGKSTLAAGLAGPLDAVVLRSDELRKQLAGIDVTTPAGSEYGAGMYSEEMTARTYAELLAQARISLSHGTSVVLDASWTDSSWRDVARSVAQDTVADLSELRCIAPAAIAEERIARRRRTRRQGSPSPNASDATVMVARCMVAADAPWPSATVVDTTAAPGDVLQRVVDHLATRKEPL